MYNTILSARFFHFTISIYTPIRICSKLYFIYNRVSSNDPVLIVNVSLSLWFFVFESASDVVWWLRTGDLCFDVTSAAKYVHTIALLHRKVIITAKYILWSYLISFPEIKSRSYSSFFLFATIWLCLLHSQSLPTCCLIIYLMIFFLG